MTAVHQVAVAVGSAKSTIVSDADKTEKNPIKTTKMGTPSKIVMVTPTSPELTEVPKWEVMDASLIKEKY